MPTCKRSDLQTLGSQPIVPNQKSPRSLAYQHLHLVNEDKPIIRSSFVLYITLWSQRCWLVSLVNILEHYIHNIWNHGLPTHLCVHHTTAKLWWDGFVHELRFEGMYIVNPHTISIHPSIHLSTGFYLAATQFPPQDPILGIRSIGRAFILS